jgi:beta-lactamase regulating signal transducer with metallopeptidase domain
MQMDFDITSISAIIAAAGVLIGVAYYILEIKQQTKVRQDLARQRETDLETRQAQLFMQLYDHYYDRDTMKDESEIIYQWKWKNFEDFWEKIRSIYEC